MGLGIRDLEKTYSGSRIQGSKRHRIPDLGSASATLQRNLTFQTKHHLNKSCRKIKLRQPAKAPDLKGVALLFSDPDPNDNRRIEDRGKVSSPRSYKCQEAHFSQNVLCLSEATPTSEQSPALPAFHRQDQPHPPQAGDAHFRTESILACFHRQDQPPHRPQAGHAHLTTESSLGCLPQIGPATPIKARAQTLQNRAQPCLPSKGRTSHTPHRQVRPTSKQNPALPAFHRQDQPHPPKAGHAHFRSESSLGCLPQVGPATPTTGRTSHTHHRQAPPTSEQNTAWPAFHRQDQPHPPEQCYVQPLIGPPHETKCRTGQKRRGLLKDLLQQFTLQQGGTRIR